MCRTASLAFLRHIFARTSSLVNSGSKAPANARRCSTNSTSMCVRSSCRSNEGCPPPDLKRLGKLLYTLPGKPFFQFVVLSSTLLVEFEWNVEARSLMLEFKVNDTKIKVLLILDQTHSCGRAHQCDYTEYTHQSIIGYIFCMPLIRLAMSLDVPHKFMRPKVSPRGNI